jgi:cell wall-associated NlpC family hydrolase
MTSIIWRSCSKYKRINSMSALKRGDILVFRGESMSTGHVGIYLGDGKMIDASSSQGQVRITSSSILKSTYWQTRFLMAYRIWD